MRTSTALILSLIVAGQAFAQDIDDRSPHSEAQLVAEVSAVRAGEVFTVALRLLMDEDWHSYWRNPAAVPGNSADWWKVVPTFTPASVRPVSGTRLLDRPCLKLPVVRCWITRGVHCVTMRSTSCTTRHFMPSGLPILIGARCWA